MLTFVLVLAGGPATAQEAPSASSSRTPVFLADYNFHISLEAISHADPRFRWDAHAAGDLDLVDFGWGRVNLLADYEVVMGDELRPFVRHEPGQLHARGVGRVPRWPNRTLRGASPRLETSRRSPQTAVGRVERAWRANATAGCERIHSRRRKRRHWFDRASLVGRLRLNGGSSHPNRTKARTVPPPVCRRIRGVVWYR
jgi:hypothetical protein